MSKVYIPEYGDNIFEIGGHCARVLHEAGWSQHAISRVHAEARAVNYEQAVAVYGRYITIEGAPLIAKATTP